MGRTQQTQLALTLPVDPALSSDDFVIGNANWTAYQHLFSWPDWPSRICLLAGPVGSGKTHLSSIFAQHADALVLSPNALPSASDLAALDRPVLVLEDAHHTEKTPEFEARLFHLINHVQEQQGALLLTSRSWPDTWGLDLPDLRSRLRAATPMELFEPDDDLLRQVLTKLFADRQLDVDLRVLDYIVVRMERSLAAAGALVEALDRLSLERSRPITRPLAAELFS